MQSASQMGHLASEQDQLLTDSSMLKTVWGHFELQRSNSQDVDSTVQATEQCDTSSLSGSSHFAAADRTGDSVHDKSSCSECSCEDKKQEDDCDDAGFDASSPPCEEALMARGAATDVGSADIDAASGECTQVMIRNILNRFSKKDLMNLLDKVGLQGTYTGVYLPIGRTRKGKSSNLGYGFVDFKSPEHVEECYKLLRGYRIGSELRQKLVEVVPATSHFPTRKFHKCPTSATEADEQGTLLAGGKAPTEKAEQEQCQPVLQHWPQPQRQLQQPLTSKANKNSNHHTTNNTNINNSPFFAPCYNRLPPPPPVGQPTMSWECIPDTGAALPIAPPPGLLRTRGEEHRSNLDHHAAPFYPSSLVKCDLVDARAAPCGPPGVFQQWITADMNTETFARFSF
eukprot:CAMPEP_0206481878 /NCGR_PEP_ID=MMETSP0324_2-20121206/38461_1 /ASSEMBLY_ACC=CAM_ASM_000836 /TAXON_ID=2866 /ORGANISM="Crypthecodinium cohnii, Strain Seligo" /LENGTH=398 /DNA_ID=CAMNT_0053959559 /DNA_START=41 /DNA_END=1237 /DNA_ORIENTATION=-